MPFRNIIALHQILIGNRRADANAAGNGMTKITLTPFSSRILRGVNEAPLLPFLPMKVFLALAVALQTAQMCTAFAAGPQLAGRLFSTWRAAADSAHKMRTTREKIKMIDMHSGDHAPALLPFSRRTAIAGALMAPGILLPTPPASSAVGAVKIKLGAGAKGLEVPQMGVGAWSWGDTDTWNFGTAQGASEASVAEAYRACLSNGITFIDTAEIYGMGVSESILGRLLADTPSAQRSKVQIATKFYPYDPKDGGVRARTAAELLPALDASLKRLQVTRRYSA